ncbi:gamma-glutamyltransferase family protein [Sagittula sp. NFXS13]|uniref:gamma-glutamyltransferase family protein n=1 Tax=Sagittula sp. NFXS13 TaxID=2819095 RepID=UPI0032DFC537
MRDFHKPGRSGVLADSGMCATSHPLAASAAIDILRQGGNAMDAAIAGALILGCAEPAMTGIGGDCFALVAKPGADVIAVNGSGRAPAALTADQMRANGHSIMPLHDANAVSIPGAIDGFCAMSKRFGTLGLADSLAPAIRYMEDGIPIAARAAFDYGQSSHVLQAGARAHFLPWGRLPHVGDRLALPGQADVLRRIARDGRDAFYTGDVAEDMVTSLRALGGTHTLDDFAAQKTTFHAPLSGHYKTRELLEHPPNGQGVTAHLLLNILSRFDIAAMDPFGADRVHIEAEAARLAYDARNRFIADADHMDRLDHLLSPDTADRLAALIDPKRANAALLQSADAVHRDTIYITVVDRDRMAVSLIYSIFHGFGSGLASEKFGILFQNRGAGFSLAPGHPNELAGGKRPMHTIIPGMVRDDGRIAMPFGVMGGQYQPMGHARLLSNLTDFGMDPQTAIDAPRSFADGPVLKLERGYSADVAAELAARGHKIDIPEVPIGGAQAIVIHPSGVLEGASDPRKDGCAIGY